MLPINQPPPATAVLPDGVPRPLPVAAQVQAPVQLKANKLSLDVLKFYLGTPSPRVLFQLSVFMCLPCFSFAGVFHVLYSRCVGDFAFYILFKFAMLVDFPFYFLAFHNFTCCSNSFSFTVALIFI